MKTNAKKIILVSSVIALLMTAASCVFSYIAMTKDFDHTLGYFNLGSVCGTLALYLPLVSAAVALVCSILIRKKTSFHDSPKIGNPTVFASVLAGLLMAVFAFFGATGEEPLTRLESAIVIFAVLSAIYFILLPFCQSKSFMTVLSFVPGIWAALRLLEEYFREGGPINSPIRTINLTMLAFLLLFFAEEIRFGIGTQLSGSYVFCLLSAIGFTANATFPKIAVIFSDSNEFFGFNFMEWCLGAALFLFLVARLVSIFPALGEYIPVQKKKSKLFCKAVSEVSEDAESSADDPDSETVSESTEEPAEESVEESKEKSDKEPIEE